MRLSASTEYAIRILTYMSYDVDKIYSAKFLHEKLELPYKFITKIMTCLAKNKLIGVKRGRSGGFYLAKKLDQVSAADIIHSVDKSSNFERCILGFNSCSNSAPCPMHNLWQDHRQDIRQTMEKITLLELKNSRAVKN